MEEVKRKSKVVCTYLGILLLMCVASFNIYSHFQNIKQKDNEQELVEEFINKEENIEPVIEEKTPVIETKPVEEINYIMVLEIPKISLKKGLCDINEYCNRVSKNIQILSESNMPDIRNGNLMLAGHNGSSSVSFFNKLDRLNTGDSIFVYYNNLKYEYKLNNSYEVEKTGEVLVERDKYKNTITLITCKKNSKNKQVVYVAYLDNVSNY